jgi:hypothetical protein
MMKRKWVKPLRVSELRKKKLIEQYEKQQLEPYKNTKMNAELDLNLATLKDIFSDYADLVMRPFNIGGYERLRAALVLIDGLVNTVIIDDYILQALTHSIDSRQSDDLLTDPNELKEWVKQVGLNTVEVEEAEDLSNVVEAILVGDSVLLIDQLNIAFIIDTKGWEKRGVSEPSNEQVIRGPRDGFTETLRINTALIRRRIRDPQLKLISFKIGTRTKTDVAVMYIEGVAEQSVVNEVRKRLQNITFDGILESGYIEQLIEDHPWSPFPQVQYTERPDKSVSHLLEGKVVILVDGSPFALIVPAIFIQFYHSPEDYYERFLIGSLVRFIRLLSFFFALALPSFYIAFASFHPEMIPSRLHIAMAAGRATVPFPAIVEAFLMEVAVEILREASVRLPGLIGPTIGIVGALVIGEAAVRAGLVSPIMVIVVGLTTICSFVIPNYSAAIALRMLRFPTMIFAAMFGLYGIMFFGILIIIHLCSLKSFHVPYMAGFTPSRLSDLKDTIFRAPLYNMTKRPTPFNLKNIFRQSDKVQKGGENHANQTQNKTQS